MSTGTTTIDIVVIEDEHSIIDLLEHMFDNPKINMISCDSGDKGLNAIVSKKPDLVILDIMLPNLNGWQIYDYVRSDEQLQDLPIIFLSVVSMHDAGRMKQIKNNPKDRFISKPFEMSTLYRYVEELLDISIW